MRATVAAAMLLVLLPPTVPALKISEPEIDPDTSGITTRGRLMPDTEVGVFRFTVETESQDRCVGPNPPHLRAEARAEAPASGYASMISNGAVYESDNSTDPSYFVWKVTVTLTTARLAPAFEDGKYVLTADMEGCLGENQGASKSFIVKNDYFRRILVEPSAYTQRTGTQKPVTFGLLITNLGNGATKVDMTVAVEPEGCLQRVDPPGRQIVLSKAGNLQAKNTAETFLRAISGQKGFCNIHMTMNAGSDNTIATGLLNQTKTLDLNVQVVGLELPGPDISVFVASLGILMAVLATRRRRPA